MIAKCAFLAATLAATVALTAYAPTAKAEAPTEFSRRAGLADLLDAVGEKWKKRKKEVRRAMQRTRRAAWLPTLRVAASRYQRGSLNYAADLDPRFNAAETWRAGASATFRLSRLVSPPGEISWRRMLWQLEQQAERERDTVTRLYFELQRILAAAQHLGEYPLEARWRHREIESNLRSLSGLAVPHEEPVSSSSRYQRSLRKATVRPAMPKQSRNAEQSGNAEQPDRPGSTPPSEGGFK